MARVYIRREGRKRDLACASRAKRARCYTCDDCCVLHTAARKKAEAAAAARCSSPLLPKEARRRRGPVRERERGGEALLPFFARSPLFLREGEQQ